MPDCIWAVHKAVKSATVDMSQFSIPSAFARFNMRALKFVTGNPNKVIEVNAILGGLIPVEPVALDIPEIQGSLEEIASDKCRRAARIVLSPMDNSFIGHVC